MDRISTSELRETLSGHSPHLATILDGAIHSFEDTENPLRITNTANALRELVREFFEIIAPDKKIKQTHWFEPDESAKNGVTRAHRVRYSVYGHLPRSTFEKDFTDDVMELEKTVRKKIDTLSKLTHVNSKVLLVQEPEALQRFNIVVDFLEELIDAVASAKDRVHSLLAELLQERLDDLMVGDFFDDLDQLSTHTRPQYVEDLEVAIDSVGADRIDYSGTGSALCETQFGSDGDVRRGDGLEGSANIPFKFSGSVPITDPRAVELEASDLEFDPSDYWGDPGDD